MAIVDNAVYVDGHRSCEPDTLEETYELLRERHGMGWIGLYRPDPLEIESVAAEFGIHRLAVDDTISAHQRPKLERYGDVLFTVLRSARYLDDEGRSSSGSCMSSPARISSSPSGMPNRRISDWSASGWRRRPSC